MREGGGGIGVAGPDGGKRIAHGRAFGVPRSRGTGPALPAFPSLAGELFGRNSAICRRDRGTHGPRGGRAIACGR